MSKQKLLSTQQVSLQFFAIDWILVCVGIVWMLLLWTYGATAWQKVVLGFGTALWWSVGAWWVRAREKLTRNKEFSLQQISARWCSWWLVWLLAVGINVFTSQIPVQSVSVWFWWCMGGLWFWWWGSLVNPRLRNWLVVHILGGSLALFVPLSWLMAWLNPVFLIQSSLSASPNFLLPFFGHHHIAALIVLIWPLWWAVKQWWKLNAKNQQYGMYVWLLLLGGTIWFSFSRSAWLAILLQVGIFSWLHREAVKQNLKIWALSGGIFVLVVLTGFLLKDLVQSQSFSELPKPIKQLCYQWWAPDSLCSVAPEPRLQYWQQTIVVWQQFPWFGSGLDTFGQVAKRWQTNSLFQTQYPHQVFLQVLSEQGLFGLVVWLGFFGLVFFEFFQQLRQKTAVQNWPFFLAIFGALIIGNLDFDWQLAGFWWPLLMILCCIIVAAKTKSVKAKKSSQWLLVGALSLAVFGGGVSLVTYLHLIAGKTDQWLKVWPYSAEWQSLTSQKVSDRTLWQRVVQRYYRQHSEVWFGAMTNIHDSKERWFWLEQLWLLDPLRYWETNPLATARKNQDVTQINLVLDRLQQWGLSYPESKVYRHNPAFAAELFELADQSLQQENWQVAEKSLALAQIFDPWILHNRLSTMTYHVPATESAAHLLRIFTGLNQTNYGDNLPRYRLWYRQLATAQTNRLLKQRVDLVGAAPISTQYLPATDKNLHDWSESVALLGAQSLVLLPDAQSREAELSEKLAALLIEAGDATVWTEKNRVSELYQLAQKIEPWALNGKLWWFERMRLVKPATAEFLQFAADWSRATPEMTGYKPHAWILFYNRVLLLSLRSGNSAAAFESVSGVKHYWSQAKMLTAP